MNLLTRAGLALVCSALTGGLAGALPPSAQPGTFVHYELTQSGETHYLGLLAASESDYLVRLASPAANRSTLFQVTLTESAVPGANRWAYAGVLRLDGSADHAAAASIPALVLRLFNERRAAPDPTPGAESLRAESPEETSLYAYWVPLVQLERLSAKTPAGPSLRLLTFGQAASNDDPRFFAYAGPTAPLPGPSPRLTPGPPRSLTLGGLRLSLDSLWSGDEAGVQRLSQATDQDAVLVVDSFDLAEYGLSDPWDTARALLLAAQEGEILAPTVQVGAVGGVPVLRYQSLDPATRLSTTRTSVFFSPPSRDPAVRPLILLNLAVYTSLYEANRAYFDGLIF